MTHIAAVANYSQLWCYKLCQAKQYQPNW